jgi:hypothetical protein
VPGQFDDGRTTGGQQGEREAVGRAQVGEPAGAHAGVDAVDEGAGGAEQQHGQVGEVTVHGNEFDTSVKLLDYVVNLLD